MNEKYPKLINCFFARHETFCPRYGWLKKGFDRIVGYNGFHGKSEIFDADEAIEKLGVGKNMVRSIRFWCMAFRIIESETTKSETPRISGPMKPTRFGKMLLAENGWDPYLEDPASLWLLHWKLFTPPYLATAWSLAINLSTLGSFNMHDLTQALLDQKESISNFKRYSDSSFQKDASCFIRMYRLPEKQMSDEIECPFTQLELLIPSDKPQTYRFNLEDKQTLPDSIFLAACFEYAHMTQQSKSISLGTLTYGFNSPGVVFKLSETEVGNRLEKNIPEIDGIAFTESYGNRQLQLERSSESFESFHWDVLNRYYKGSYRTGFIK